MSSCVDIACPLKRNRLKLTRGTIIESFRNSESFNYSWSVSSESAILQGTIRLNTESQIVISNYFSGPNSITARLSFSHILIKYVKLVLFVNYRKRDVKFY